MCACFLHTGNHCLHPILYTTFFSNCKESFCPHGYQFKTNSPLSGSNTSTSCWCWVVFNFCCYKVCCHKDLYTLAFSPAGGLPQIRVTWSRIPGSKDINISITLDCFLKGLSLFRGWPVMYKRNQFQDTVVNIRCFHFKKKIYLWMNDSFLSLHLFCF